MKFNPVYDERCPECGLTTLESNGEDTRCASSTWCPYGWKIAPAQSLYSSVSGRFVPGGLESPSIDKEAPEAEDRKLAGTLSGIY